VHLFLGSAIEFVRRLCLYAQPAREHAGHPMPSYPPPLGRKARKRGRGMPTRPGVFPRFAAFQSLFLPFAPARAAGKDNHSTKLADVPKATRFLCGGGAIPASPGSVETPSFLEFSQRRRQHQDGSGWRAVVDVDGQAKTISSEYFD
jgi:hypothetical protein